VLAGRRQYGRRNRQRHRNTQLGRLGRYSIEQNGGQEIDNNGAGALHKKVLLNGIEHRVVHFVSAQPNNGQDQDVALAPHFH
jgi:hypothetical protein